MIGLHQPVGRLTWLSQSVRYCCNRECLDDCAERTCTVSSRVFHGIIFACGFATAVMLVPIAWLLSESNRRPDPEAIGFFEANQIETEV